jgi:hypothetical protein
LDAGKGQKDADPSFSNRARFFTVEKSHENEAVSPLPSSTQEFRRMKKMLVWIVIYLAGAISGVIYNYTTNGAKDRSRIAALESEVNAQSEKLNKCANALIEGIHPNAPAPPPAPK